MNSPEETVSPQFKEVTVGVPPKIGGLLHVVVPAFSFFTYWPIAILPLLLSNPQPFEDVPICPLL